MTLAYAAGIFLTIYAIKIMIQLLWNYFGKQLHLPIDDYLVGGQIVNPCSVARTEKQLAITRSYFGPLW